MAGTSLDDLLAALNVLIDEVRGQRADFAASLSSGGPDQFTIKDAAARLSMTEDAIHKAHERGKIESTKSPTGRIMISRQALDAFANSNGDAA